MKNKIASLRIDEDIWMDFRIFCLQRKLKLKNKMEEMIKNEIKKMNKIKKSKN